MNVVIENSWKAQLLEEFSSDWFAQLATFVRSRYGSNATVYPAPKNIFRAFDAAPFNAVKVVILGQDPYHGPSQAMGLSFSVPSNVANPPSLVNIFKELEQDLGDKSKAESDYSGNLQSWADQGVLLLNASLTVERGKAGSHAGKGWEKLTDAAIQKLSQERSGIVFMLWGNFARSKKQHIDASKHLILEAPHPSPLSVHRGFFGCKHFSACNAYLESHGQSPITW